MATTRAFLNRRLTQNHKLACTFFVHPSQVLVFDRPRKPPKNAVLLKELAERAREGERLLVIDVSRGHEPQVIPVFNGADADPAPMDFTYVTHCVVNEGLRLLLGGPLRDPWPCPYDDVAAASEDFEGMSYDNERRFVHEPHTVRITSLLPVRWNIPGPAPGVVSWAREHTSFVFCLRWSQSLNAR